MAGVKIRPTDKNRARAPIQRYNKIVFLYLNRRGKKVNTEYIK